MLEVLRRIIQEVDAAADLRQALDLIVHHVKRAMSVDVCSVYLADFEHHQHVLMASDGLNPEAVGRVRLALSEGLIGLVHERAEPLNLEDGPQHPRYRFIAETGEVRYHAFLGVPIIRHRKVLGVLVVRQCERRRFDEDEVTFLVTLAAQLAGAISHAELSGGVGGLRNGPASAPRFIEGLPGAPGVAVGTAVVVFPPADLEAVPDRPAQDVAAEQAAFLSAVEQVQNEIKALRAQVGRQMPVEDRALFDAYVMMLGSESLIGGTVQRIHAGNWAPGALRATIAEHARIFDEMEDAYLRERGADIREIGRRILVRLDAGHLDVKEYPERTILVGEEVNGPQLSEVPYGRLAGVVSARGSGSSHVAILARALGIPAVMGVSDLPVSRLDGQELLIDGYRGRLFVRPTPAMREEFLRLAREETELMAELSELTPLPAETPDGVRVPLYVNTGLLSDISPSLRSGAEGVGLYRTEFPFMARDRFPGEDEQLNVYRQVLEAFAPRPVTLRTLDVGGDKALPYFPIEEDNPFLGWRGIRITLDQPDIFLTQLRAMLRADVGFGNLRLMFPMISTLGELDEALALLGRAVRELAEEGMPVVRPPVGVMIEVPSAVYQVAVIAQRVDFLSVGTNDLTQYLLAVDRNNARVAKLYDPLHPAVLRALVQIVEGAHRHCKPVSVCGEMAGDPAVTLLLLGMGIDSLSMSVVGLPRVKWVIRSFTQARARELLQEALQLEDAVAIRSLLNTTLERAGLGGLVRAGK
ncbi:MAG: phosphoenolpyruvate--protein phosphotransferase [Gammaproteobacteria bacterium]|nr:phosphoenolpyruvate--protein phosphotransferase [Gammaproteobacteria bacterium]